MSISIKPYLRAAAYCRVVNVVQGMESNNGKTNRTDGLHQTEKTVYTKTMMLSGRKLILVLIMLWLPLQGVIAAVMPLCVQVKDFGVNLDAPPVTTIAGDHQHDVCHKQSMQSMDSTIDNVTSNLPCDGTPCNTCSATILSASSTAIPTGGSSYAISFNSHFTSFVLEQLQRPPLA